MKIQVQRNTCEIGTAEYNLALGDKKRSVPRDIWKVWALTPRDFYDQLRHGKAYGPNSDEDSRSKNRGHEFVESL